MAFEKNGFFRNENIAHSIEVSEKKSIHNDTKNNIGEIPIKKVTKEKKTYMTIYVYPSTKKKLESFSKSRGYSSVSEMIREWAKTLPNK